MSPTKKFFSGNTLEQAVLQAARFFQIDPGLVAYEPVERRHGFLKVRRRVVIGVDPENAQKDRPGEAMDTEEPASAEAVSTRPAEPSRESDASYPRPTVAEPGGEKAEAPSTGDEGDDAWKSLSPVDATEASEEALRRVLRLGGLDLSAELTTSQEGLAVELSGPDEDKLFEDRGRLLLALQHLLPRMVRGLTGASVPCRVDSDNFHEVRAEQLRMLAQDAAAQVRREGRMHTLEPMSPDERRIVHLTLAEDPAVETESHGTGLFKRVAVRPVR